MARTSLRSFVARLIFLGIFAIAGCGDRRSDFVGSRVEDTCNESWPVCDVVSGCLLGAESYRTGRFPGTGRFVVRVSEPSVVKVSFFLEQVAAAGNQTAITWYEDACRSRIRQEISGNTFVGEAQRYEAVTRQADLNAEGDHLIEFESDAQADYLVKVEVIPKRVLAKQ